ncbi:CLUMA_CG011271, isoform A [Clunio marinus]|uniref:CLUMA_CG011271, isoform A n=1 Tax=Clunio marinus TaxID=568069 RepID=A0A1J1ICE0_9DIPT|nr:CLUMA_CG011271, isoform A [Clunio marinus]
MSVVSSKLPVGSFVFTSNQTRQQQSDVEREFIVECKFSPKAHHLVLRLLNEFPSANRDEQKTCFYS